MKCFRAAANDVLFVSLGPGDLLLECIEQAVRAHDIHTGIITSGLGSLTRAGIMYQGRHVEIERKLEITGFCGIIADFKPHVHITMVDADGRFYGGHVKNGCEIKTVAEFAILRSDGVKLARRCRDGSSCELLDVQ
jgi:predicted DNA-binding protein with PD1-like motif